jgi:protease IV
VIRRFFVAIFAAVGFFFLLTIAGGVAAWWFLAPEGAEIPDGTVVTLDLNERFSESRDGDPVSELLFERELALRDVVDGLQRAAEDPRVVGLFARIGQEEHGFATAQELRDAVLAFRRSGKPAIVFADSFGEFGSGLRGYYLATAFDEIWLQPMGMVGLAGLRSETPFFRSALEKIGVRASGEKREEHKTVLNSAIEDGLTPAHREQLEQLLGSIEKQLVRDLAEARKLDPQKTARLLGSGPWLDREAKEEGLVDQIGWRDVAERAIRERTRGRSMSFEQYLDRAGGANVSGERIALIVGSGPVQRGDGISSPLSGDAAMGADALTRAFRMASADPRVRAIVFRVDSPGGSAVASETIYAETVRAKSLGKPVIVSMGDVAGSGGYYVAAAADKIVAQPGTLTGSIGVVAAKPVLTELFEKLGIKWGVVQRGESAGMFSFIEDFSAPQRRRLTVEIDSVYNGFKARVAEGRRMSLDDVEKIAGGRVFTGEDAKEKGLVDELGGYPTALRLAREAAGLGPDAPIELVEYPPERDPFDFLMERLMGKDKEKGNASSAKAWLNAVRPLLRLVERVVAPAGPLVMPPVER